MPLRFKVTGIHRQGHRDRGDRPDARNRREQLTVRIDLMLVEKSPALSPSRVILTPDGGSSGTTILLAAGAQRIAVSVNWLSDVY
jgi:hypothetical protein